jgi:cytidine deaminase
MSLDDEERGRLIDAARLAVNNAYAPFSQFRVGAAVLGHDGKIYAGCNVENASSGLSMCAERVAIFKAVSAGCRRVTALAVTCPDADPQSPSNYRMPCGACRQVITEFADGSIVVLVDDVGQFELDELLPRPFKLS